MRWRLIFLVVVWSLFLGRNEGWPRTLVESEIQEVHQSMELEQNRRLALQMNFTQSVQMPGEESAVRSQGIIRYLKPGRLRIDFSDPAGDRLLFNPEMTVVLKKGNEPRVERMDSTSPPSGYRRVLLDLLERKPSVWKTDYRISMEENQKIIRVTLMPKQKSDRFPDRIQVQLHRVDWNFSKIEVWIHGVRLCYEFSGHLQNPILAKTLFEWKETNAKRPPYSTRSGISIH